MRKVYFMVFAMLATFMISCNTRKTAPGIFPEDGIVTMVREFPSGGITRSDGQTFTVTAVLDAEAEKITSFSISEEFYETINMTEEEVDLYLRNEMGIFYDDLSNYAFQTIQPSMGMPVIVQTGPIGNLVDCRKDCLNTTPPNSWRRISCLAKCWGDLVLELLDILLP